MYKRRRYPIVYSRLSMKKTVHENDDVKKFMTIYSRRLSDGPLARLLKILVAKVADVVPRMPV
jgi:hypothetical protein